MRLSKSLQAGRSRYHVLIVARKAILQEIVQPQRRTESRAVPGRTLREGVTRRAIGRPEHMEMAEIRAEEDILAAREEKPVQRMRK
jgi:hypothetical protein